MAFTPKYKEWLTGDAFLRLQAWCRSGFTDKELAEKMGINKDTLYEWKKKYPDFAEIIAKNKEVVDIQVENALLRKALGYDWIEEVEEYNAKLDKMIITKRTRKQMPPDSLCMMFWLKNRKPTEWRDKKDVAVETSDKGGIVILPPIKTLEPPKEENGKK